MSDNDDNETQGVVFGVLAGVIFGIIALVAGLGMWKASQPAAPAAQVAAAEPDIAPIGDALAKVYFAVGKAERGGPTNPDIWLSEISASMGDGNRLPRSRSNEKTPP